MIALYRFCHSGHCIKHNEVYSTNTSAEFHRRPARGIRRLEEAQKTGVYVLNSFLYTQGVVDSLNKGELHVSRKFLGKAGKDPAKQQSLAHRQYFYLSAHYHLYCGKTSRPFFQPEKG